MNPADSSDRRRAGITFWILVGLILSMWGASEVWLTAVQVGISNERTVVVGQLWSTTFVEYHADYASEKPIVLTNQRIEQGSSRVHGQIFNPPFFPKPRFGNDSQNSLADRILTLPHWLILLLAILTRLAFFFTKRSRLNSAESAAEN